MKSEYNSAIKSGIVTGLIWACLTTVASVVSFELYYSRDTVYYNALLASDPNAVSGWGTSQYVLNLALGKIIQSPPWGVVSAILIELFLVATRPALLARQSYPMKGLIVGLIVAIVYFVQLEATLYFEISFFLVIDPSLAISTLLVYSISGVAGGVLYQRFKNGASLSKNENMQWMR